MHQHVRKDRLRTEDIFNKVEAALLKIKQGKGDLEGLVMCNVDLGMLLHKSVIRSK